MRVLHVASFHGTAAGGFIPMIAALARRLRARGDDVALVAPDVLGARWHAKARDAGLELHLVEGSAAAGRFARAWRADLVHVHFYGWEIALTLALWTSRARIIWHAHSVYRWDGPARPSLRSLVKYRLVGRRVERFITVSHAVAGDLIRVGAPRGRVVAVPNAVDGARFRPPAPPERRLARAALGLGDDAAAILFFGRHPRLKGADVLGAALANLPGTTVVTVATPPDARRDLAQHARVIAIERVDDVVPLMWAADALAVPSRGEGFGLVLLEAALTSLPVAASDLPALREAAAAAASNVYFAPVEDANALGRALRAALASPRMDTPRADRDDPLARWAETIAALYC